MKQRFFNLYVGILILLESNILGAAACIIFGLFPPAPYANHLFAIIDGKLALPHHLPLLIGAAFGSLPIIGGLLALARALKFRAWFIPHHQNLLQYIEEPEPRITWKASLSSHRRNNSLHSF